MPTLASSTIAPDRRQAGDEDRHGEPTTPSAPTPIAWRRRHPRAACRCAGAAPRRRPGDAQRLADQQAGDDRPRDGARHRARQHATAEVDAGVGQREQGHDDEGAQRVQAVLQQLEHVRRARARRVSSPSTTPAMVACTPDSGRPPTRERRQHVPRVRQAPGARIARSARRSRPPPPATRPIPTSSKDRDDRDRQDSSTSPSPAGTAAARGMRSPSSARIPTAKAMSVAAGIAQPAAPSLPAVKPRAAPGTPRPRPPRPPAAPPPADRAARRRRARVDLQPHDEEDSAMSPSLTQCCRSRSMSAPMPSDSCVCHRSK